MNELFGLNLTEEELIARAAEIGSDTAFFVRNTPQLCTGRGEVMTPISLPLKGLWLAVVKSVGEGVSTAEAYGGVKPAEPNVPLEQRLQLPVNQWQGMVKNDFEEHIFRACPMIKELKARLLDAGAIFASMSGSGSAVFGLFTERPELNFDSYIFTHIERL
jgi:4-diphosphocytidyl-2-C-methyl-D-erythritol kinase